MTLWPTQGLPREKASAIQYGYKKCEAHARVTPKHLHMKTARMKQHKEPRGRKTQV